MDNWMIYTGVGLGVVVLLGIVYAVRRKNMKKNEDVTNDIYPLW